MHLCLFLLKLIVSYWRIEAQSAEESFVLGFSEAEEIARMVACVEKVVSAKQLKRRTEGQPNRIEP